MPTDWIIDDYDTTPARYAVLRALLLPAWRCGSAWWALRPVHLLAQAVPPLATAPMVVPRETLLAAVLDHRAVVVLVVVAACYAVSVCSAIGSITRSAAPRWARSLGYLMLSAVGAAAALLSVGLVLQVRLLDEVFITAPPIEPSRTTPSEPVAATAVPGRVMDPVRHRPDRLSPSTDPLPAAIGERFNVLLIGSDAGPGRYGARADSLLVVSVGRDGNGDLTDVAVVAVPRNLQGPLVPVGFESVLGERFDGMINAAHTWATGRPDRRALVEEVLGPTDEPGWTFTAALVAETTGLRIDAFAAVDMAGFIELVDAFGGLDVHVPSAVPSPGNVPAGKHPLPEFYETGWQRMDGTDALGYVRSRSADSDYRRMGRQRCVLASLAAQHGTTKLLTGWPAIASAITDHVRTSLSSKQVTELLVVASFPTDQIRVLSLVPPLVTGTNLYEIRSLVGDFLGSVATPTRATDGRTAPTSALPVPVPTTVSDEDCKVRP